MRIALSALAVAVLAVVASGCGGSGGRRAVAPATPPAPAPKTCKLTAAQQRAIARSRRDIRRLREIQKPLHTFSQHGTPEQQSGTNQFLLDSGNLPVNVRARLLHLAKASVGLCGLCFGALEAEEPVLAGKLGRNPCGSA